MQGFREFMQQQPYAAPQQQQAWRMPKEQIIQHWQSLRPNTPIQFTPIKADKKGSTFSEDGIRLTGSRNFIDSILSRLKDLANYESPTTKLNLVYRQTQYKGTEMPENNQTFVFYLQAKERKPQQLGKQDGPTPQLPAPQGPTAPTG